jgi:hypothetical protein
MGWPVVLPVTAIFAWGLGSWRQAVYLAARVRTGRPRGLQGQRRPGTGTTA